MPRERGKVSVGDANDLGRVDPDTFDVVYLNAVFHWLPEKTEPLRQFYRVLEPGGRLGISTGSKDHVSPLQQIRRAVLAREPYRAYPESSAGFPNRVSQDELGHPSGERAAHRRRRQTRSRLSQRSNGTKAIMTQARQLELGAFMRPISSTPVPGVIRARSRMRTSTSATSNGR